MSVADIEAAKRRLLFSCAVCEEEGGPRAAVRHTGLLSLQQHYRSIHPGQPVRRGCVQEEPPYLFTCSGCEAVFAAHKSYSNHRHRTSVAACHDGQCTQMPNPHKGGPAFEIEMPRTVSAPRAAKRPEPAAAEASLSKKTRAADLLTPLRFVPEQGDQQSALQVAAVLTTLTDQRPDSATQPADSIAPPVEADSTAQADQRLTTTQTDQRPAEPDSVAHTDQRPADLHSTAHADQRPATSGSPAKDHQGLLASTSQIDAIQSNKSSPTLQDALRRYISDPAQVQRRLAVYSGLGLNTIDQVRYIQRLPHAVRFYLCQYGPNASDFGQLFLFNDLE